MTRFCSLEDCERPLYATELCSLHYERVRRTGHTNHVPRLLSTRICGLGDCLRPHSALGLCGMHYSRQRKSGTTDAPKRNQRKQSTAGRPGSLKGPCAVPLCYELSFLKGTCTLHYNRMLRTGTFDGPSEKLEAKMVEIEGAFAKGTFDQDWSTIFSDDPVVLGQVIRDVLLLGASDPRRSGRRTADKEALVEEAKTLGKLHNLVN